MMDTDKLLKRILPYIRGKQVILGKDRTEDLVRRHEAGLVWLTEDLAKNAAKKAITKCLETDIPCIWTGDSNDILEATGLENIKVITLRKSFSGIKHIIDELKEADLVYEERALRRSGRHKRQGSLQRREHGARLDASWARDAAGRRCATLGHLDRPACELDGTAGPPACLCTRGLPD